MTPGSMHLPSLQIIWPQQSASVRQGPHLPPTQAVPPVQVSHGEQTPGGGLGVVQGSPA